MKTFPSSLPPWKWLKRTWWTKFSKPSESRRLHSSSSLLKCRKRVLTKSSLLSRFQMSLTTGIVNHIPVWSLQWCVTWSVWLRSFIQKEWWKILNVEITRETSRSVVNQKTTMSQLTLWLYGALSSSARIAQVFCFWDHDYGRQHDKLFLRYLYSNISRSFDYASSDMRSISSNCTVCHHQ